MLQSTLMSDTRWVAAVTGLALALTVSGCSGRASDTGASTGTGGGAAATSTATTGSASSTSSTSSSTSSGGFTFIYSFDTDTDIQSAQPADATDTDPNDLGVNGSPKAAASFDATVGNPDPGSLKVELPCTAYNQFVDYQFIFPINQDLGDKTLSVMLMLDEGFTPDPNAPGGIILYAKSGDNWDWGQASWANIGPDMVGKWTEFTFPMSDPGTGSTAQFDPAVLRSIGIKLDTGTGTGTTLLPTPAVFHIDSIGYR